MKLKKLTTTEKPIGVKQQIILQNLRENKCAFCGSGKNVDVSMSITDSETLKEIVICDECDKMLEWGVDYPNEVEEINDDKRHNL